jgi:putative endonuclease
MRIPNPLAREGEEIAANYLKSKGFKIIDRNFRARNTELDIVAIHEHTLVFIEVKTRTSEKFGTPLEQIAFWKLKSLIKAAEFYKLTHNNLPDLMRIDAVSVKYDSKGPVVEHTPNISGF